MLNLSIRRRPRALARHPPAEGTIPTAKQQRLLHRTRPGNQKPREAKATAAAPLPAGFTFRP